MSRSVLCFSFFASTFRGEPRGEDVLSLLSEECANRMYSSLGCVDKLC